MDLQKKEAQKDYNIKEIGKKFRVVYGKKFLINAQFRIASSWTEGREIFSW